MLAIVPNGSDVKFLGECCVARATRCDPKIVQMGYFARSLSYINSIHSESVEDKVMVLICLALLTVIRNPLVVMCP